MGSRRISAAGQGCSQLRLLLIVMGVASAVAGCGREPAAVVRFDDVVARVDGKEITVQQLKLRLQQTGLPSNGDEIAMRRQILDSLIDEHLLAGRALARGLDQDLEIRNSIEDARRQILAKAAVSALAEEDGVSEREVRAFYVANPALFANRKIYTFHRFVLGGGGMQSAARVKLDSARTDADVIAVLKAYRIPYSHHTELRPAESLPASILSRAARMARGDIILFTDGARTTLLQLIASSSEPVAMTAVLPSIRAYMADAKQQEKAEYLVKELRRKAKLEYVTQTASAPTPTTLADGKRAVGEPPSKKPLQSQQVTVVR